MTFRRSIIALLPLCVLLVSACEPSDRDLVLNFINEWMEQHELVTKDPKTGEYSPNLVRAGLVASGWATTGDPRVDAAVSAGVMVHGIRETDKLTDQALVELNKNPPDIDNALDKMNGAVNARPNDWYYLNRRAIVHAANGNESRATQDFRTADEACGGNQRCLDAAQRDRDALLENGWK